MGDTTLAKARLAPPKTQVKTALEGPSKLEEKLLKILKSEQKRMVLRVAREVPLVLSVILILCSGIFVGWALLNRWEAPHVSNPPNIDSPFRTLTDAASWGSLVGGVLGPILSVASFLLIYYSFTKQMITSRKQLFREHLYELIKYNRETISAIDYVNSDSSTRELISGDKFFQVAKQQLDGLYKFLLAYNPSMEEKKRIQICFTLFYYGVSIDAAPVTMLEINKYLVTGKSIALVRKVREKKTHYDKKIVYYGGHQGKLSHYFRQLHFIVETIEKTDLYDDVGKKELIKTIRTQMSNYEQAILFYNSLTFLGKDWETSGYITKYELIKNIPNNFFHFTHKKYYREINYEN